MSVRRSRVVALVTAILCLALAAAAVRLSEARPDFDVHRGRVGSPVQIDDGAVIVESVRVATSLAREGTVTDTTPGLFVVVTVTGAATRTAPLSLSEARLVARHGHVYRLYGGGAGVQADPGFGQRIDLVFEVDPTQIDDLTLQLSRLEVVHGYQAQLSVHLGITPGNAAAWRAAGAGQAVDPDTLGLVRALT